MSVVFVEKVSIAIITSEIMLVGTPLKNNSSVRLVTRHFQVVATCIRIGVPSIDLKKDYLGVIFVGKHSKVVELHT